jgi:SAM-dependent methyltransferase
MPVQPTHAERVLLPAMLSFVEDPKSIVRRGYDLVSRAYRADDEDDGPYAGWLELLEKRVESRSAVLDLGCGCGMPVARRLARRYAVTGVDLSPVQITRARELVPDATFVCADMTATRFPDESFSAITCLFALIHLPVADQPTFLRSVRRWLRPGGLFLATVGHRAWTGLEKDWLGVKGGDMWWSHADVSTYRRWFAEAGLQIESETFIPEGTGGHPLMLATR